MRSDHRLADYAIVYVALLLFFAVGAITTLGLGWYGALTLPAWMPTSLTVAVVWCVLFLLTALSAIEVWDKVPPGQGLSTMIKLYPGNALLVLLWNYLFFGAHELLLALIAAVLVLASVLALIVSVRRVTPKGAWLLAPYLLWMLAAVYINYAVWSLN